MAANDFTKRYLERKRALSSGAEGEKRPSAASLLPRPAMHAPARGNRPITERPSEPDLGELDAQRQAARQALEDTRQEQRAVAARENLARRSRGIP